MKTFKHILPFLLALLVLAGCEDDVNYTQGTAENPDCYGVYFPKKQATRTDLEFEPGTQTEATYTVKRRNTVDPIVVPVVVKSNVEDIFVVEPIAFDAGEDETTFTISFPKAQMGTTYTCDINIEDPRYASIYGADKVNLSISLVLAKWELVTDEKTGETKGRYRDDILGNFASIDNPNANPNPEIELEIYERSDKKGYYRMKAYTPELMNIFAGGQVNHENRNVCGFAFGEGHRVIVDPGSGKHDPLQTVCVGIEEFSGIFTFARFEHDTLRREGNHAVIERAILSG